MKYGIKAAIQGKEVTSQNVEDLNFDSALAQLKISKTGQKTLPNATAQVQVAHDKKYTPIALIMSSNADGFYYPNQNTDVYSMGDHAGVSMDNYNIYIEPTQAVDGGTLGASVSVSYVIFFEPQWGESLNVFQV